MLSASHTIFQFKAVQCNAPTESDLDTAVWCSTLEVCFVVDESLIKSTAFFFKKKEAVLCSLLIAAVKIKILFD